jgi:hypothetical protein
LVVHVDGHTPPPPPPSVGAAELAGAPVEAAEVPMAPVLEVGTPVSTETPVSPPMPVYPELPPELTMTTGAS